MYRILNFRILQQIVELMLTLSSYLVHFIICCPVDHYTGHLSEYIEFLNTKWSYDL